MMHTKVVHKTPERHQLEAVEFAKRKLYDEGLKAVIFGDEQGLGKTFASILLINEIKEINYVLVVCEAGLLNDQNWPKELREGLIYDKHNRFIRLDLQQNVSVAPGVINVCQSGRAIIGLQPSSVAMNLRQANPRGKVFLVSYETLRTKWGQDNLGGFEWDLVIVDEFQKIKKSRSLATKAVHSLKGKKFILVSATPADKIEDYYPTLHFLEPKSFYNESSFQRAYCRPGMEQIAAEEIAKVLDKYRIRRLKEDVMPDIPPKVKMIQAITLPPDVLDELKSMYSGNGDVDNMEEMSKVAVEIYEEIEAMIESGQKIPEEVKQKAIDISEKALQSVRQFNQRIIDSVSKIRVAIGEAKALNGGYEAIRDLMATLKPSDGVVIFYNHKVVGDILSGFLEMDGVAYSRVDGTMNRNIRTEAIKRFKDRRSKVFLASIHATKTGLNLTEAALAVNFEPDWSHMVNEQADDRIHRIGQKKVVRIVYLVAAKTMDTHIINIMRLKGVIVNLINRKEKKHGKSEQ